MGPDELKVGCPMSATYLRDLGLNVPEGDRPNYCGYRTHAPTLIGFDCQSEKVRLQFLRINFSVFTNIVVTFLSLVIYFLCPIS